MKSAKTSHRTYQKGLWAEYVCAWVLRLKGYRILARRYKTPRGEVDLIAKRAHHLAFVEVKYRPDEEAGLVALTPRQAARIKDAAQIFVSQHPSYAACDQRLDLMIVRPFRWPVHLVNLS